MNRRFVILDRDGTLIVERHYLVDPDHVELLPEVGAGLRAMRQMGLGLVVLTNQSAIGRGMLTTQGLSAIHERLSDLLAAENVTIDGFYFCPHKPEDQCKCRKPEPGLLHRAAHDLGFAAHECLVIGDKPCDIDLGRGLGLTTILVRTGYGAFLASSRQAKPDYVVDDLVQAAGVISKLLACNAQ